MGNIPFYPFVHRHGSMAMGCSIFSVSQKKSAINPGLITDVLFIVVM